MIARCSAVTVTIDLYIQEVWSYCTGTLSYGPIEGVVIWAYGGVPTQGSLQNLDSGLDCPLVTFCTCTGSEVTLSTPTLGRGGREGVMLDISNYVHFL